ncbi:GNAT family N-acetyltransferase [Staphylococcus sp. HMSC056D08]|uniref:GNAT family N-acetyltransferase n=1 Tax=Staphylococcus sp. HMSC056D08 TaxID=1739455 RepID=UPI0008A9C4DE|nr:GNAT family N-acetyltransferase [Staphylococcus sp. HMSC056D08]OHR50447.1 acetyltransferase [Staphylococcus sp. HMSC056D08]
MGPLSMRLIDQPGTIAYEDEQKTIYLTPQEPLTYYTNKWVYHDMPTFETWLEDVKTQTHAHLKQESRHLAFTFPENTPLDSTFSTYFERENFDVVLLEMYAIEAHELAGDIPDGLDIRFVDIYHLDDYLKICRYFSLDYGKDYADEVVKTLRQQFDGATNVKRVIAYKDNQPVGTLDMIESEETIEIDSFGVIKEMRGQGIGRAMQGVVANYAKHKPLILIADGEDTAKEMYIKQGYTFISYCYSVIKENI